MSQTYIYKYNVPKSGPYFLKVAFWGLQLKIDLMRCKWSIMDYYSCNEVSNLTCILNPYKFVTRGLTHLV